MPERKAIHELRTRSNVGRDQRRYPHPNFDLAGCCRHHHLVAVVGIRGHKSAGAIQESGDRNHRSAYGHYPHQHLTLFSGQATIQVLRTKDYFEIDDQSALLPHPAGGCIARFFRRIMAAKKEIAEIGFYAYGFGLFYPGFFELFVRGLSLRVFKDGEVARFEIRGNTDAYAALFLNGNRQIGTQGKDLRFTFFGSQDNDPGVDGMRLTKEGLAVRETPTLPTVPPLQGESLLFIHEGKLKLMNQAGEVSVLEVA